MNAQYYALLLLLFSCNITLIAQENKRIQRDVVDDKRIYFFLDEKAKAIKYFLTKTGKDGNGKIADNDIFSMKRSNSCNIFFKWLNPLNYRIAFKDTVYTSPTDIAINDYVKTYIAVLGTGTIPAPSTKSLNLAMQKLTEPAGKGVITGATLISEKTAFENRDLNLLLLQLLSAKLTPSDSPFVNDLISNLHELEKLLLTNNVALINNDFEKLKSISDYKKVTETVDRINIDIKDKYEDNLRKTEEAQKSLNPLKLSLSNKPLQAFAEITVKDFIKQVETKVKSDKQLIQKLRDIAKVMTESVSEPLLDEKENGYFQIKTVEFSDDQNFETSFIVSSYEMDNEKHEVVKKGDVVSSKIIFEKFDPVKVNISTGIFFANFTLKSFGVSQGTDSLVVSEDNIKSNTAIPATFLNLQFDLGSRHFLPIFQLGADPTKKRPLILLGIGVAIPSSKFAITGGPIWTWDQSLDQLSVGKTVSSTTNLEKDIKYKFSGSPKGWYLGFQFNF